MLTGIPFGTGETKGIWLVCEMIGPSVSTGSVLVVSDEFVSSGVVSGVGIWMVGDGVVAAIVVFAVVTSVVSKGFGFALAAVGSVVFGGFAAGLVVFAPASTDGSVVDVVCTVARTKLCIDASDATVIDR
jgi:hypothetical protein